MTRAITCKVIADMLDEARALIEKGWCQTTYSDGDGFCPVGAINQVIHGNAENDETTAAWANAVLALEGAIGRDAYIGLPNWNDAPERTQAEVIEAFRKAAELARAEQSA